MRLNGVTRLLTLIAVFALVVAACSSDSDSDTTTTTAASEETTTTAAAGETTTTAAAETTTTAANAEPVTIKLLLRPDEGENIANFAAQFEAETGNTVEVDFVGWGDIYNKTLTTLASGGGGYDIIFIPSANVVEFTSGGWFEPVDDLIASDSDAWLPAVVDLYTVDGNLLAMPWYSGGAHMAYNKSVLDAAGVDPAAIKTMDDFMAACEAVKTSGAADFCFSPSAKYPGNFYYNWGTISATTGEPLFDDAGAPLFAENGSAEFGFDIMATGIANGYFDPAGVALDDYETLIEFGAGTTAFLLDSTWAVTQAAKNEELSGVTGNVGYILIPGSASVESAGYLYAGGMGLMASSENKDVAKALMQYLTSEAAQKDHAIEGANLPTRVALFSDPDIAAAWDGFDMLASQLNYGSFPPQFGWFEEWRQSSAGLTQDVINGAKTPAEATAELTAETDRLRQE
jgi:ABC-type glycerol-3-phosphate transport system substrate-binding protein